MAKLRELASTIRSKNAGVDHITFDIICREPANYVRVKQSNVLSREGVAALFDIPVERVSHFTVFEPANAIKFTIRRLKPSGSPGETDVFGSQQYAPLFDLEIP
jgi:hypothetical protein